MVKVLYGSQPNRIFDSIDFDDSDLSDARWLYNLMCKSDDPNQKYVELMFDDGLVRKTVERQLKF